MRISDWSSDVCSSDLSGRIYTAADIAEDPHFHARDMIERHALPDSTPIDFPGIVPKLSATPGRTKWVGPELGAHTQEVLGSLGIDADELARDRTSVVSGRRGSVRLGLGGRRLMKTQNNINSEPRLN